MPPSTSNIFRRSSRLQTRTCIVGKLEPQDEDEGNSKIPNPSPTCTNKIPARKRKGGEVKLEVKEETRSIQASPSKKKKAYSPPEKYAHLNVLTDRLGEEVDVLFCGINPGKRSAEVGFHYAHPSNQFWKCLHKSGWTDRRLDPSEEHVLPGSYNIGLTDLVERPTSMAIELSKEEMVDGVSVLLNKIRKYRPRSVCFVGMEIGFIFEKKIKMRLGFTGREAGKIKKRIGLLPYKSVHSGDLLETLFYVIPSTSGANGTYLMDQKVEAMAALRKIVEEQKAGILDTSQMTIVATSGHSVQLQNTEQNTIA